MRRKSVVGRVSVRRRSPRPAMVLALLVAVALFAFVFFARPAIDRLSLQIDEAPVAAEKVTRDISFDAMSLYLVELCRGEDEGAVRIEAARYVPRGAAGYLYQMDDAFLVIGAGYGDRADAETVAAQLDKAEPLTTQVHEALGEAALLRVTATEGQLKALIEAEQVLRTLSSALQSHAIALDRGEMDAPTLRAAASLEANQARSAMAALTRAAGDRPNSVATALIDQLADLTDALDHLSGDTSESALTLSSKVKYSHIDARLRHIAFLNQLSA